MSKPCAMAWQTSGMARADPSSWTTDSTVSVMFVPVSPSGTGYTFSRFRASWWIRGRAGTR